jgi:hypothetical protein
MPQRTRNKDLSGLLHEEERQAEAQAPTRATAGEDSARRAARVHLTEAVQYE